MLKRQKAGSAKDTTFTSGNSTSLSYSLPFQRSADINSIGSLVRPSLIYVMHPRIN